MEPRRYGITSILQLDIIHKQPCFSFHFYCINILITFLAFFRRFPTTFWRFPNIYQKLFECQTNVSEHFPKISVDWAPAKLSQHANATLLGATCCVRLAILLRHVGCCWVKFAHSQTWANNTQRVATHRNTVARRTTGCAQQCCNMLRWQVAILWPGL